MVEAPQGQRGGGSLRVAPGRPAFLSLQPRRMRAPALQAGLGQSPLHLAFVRDPAPAPHVGPELRRVGGRAPGPPPWGFRTETAEREPPGMHCPPSPCAGRHRDLRHGHRYRHPRPNPARSGRTTRHGPGPGPAPLLAPPPQPAGPLRIRRGGGPRAGLAAGEGKVFLTFAPPVPRFRLHGPQTLCREMWPPVWNRETPRNGAFSWSLSLER